MREALYGAMLRAPFKIGGSLIGIGSAAASLWPAKISAWLDASMSAETIRLIGIVGLIAVVAYVAALWLLKPPAKELRGEGGLKGQAATTLGAGSPALAGTFGDVHFHSPAQPVQERQPEPARGSGPIVTPLNQATADRMREEVNPKAEMALNDVVIRVYASLGGVPRTSDAGRRDFLNRVDLKIMDEVTHHKMHVSARSGKRALRPITDHEWEHGTFDHLKNELRVPVAYSNPYALTDMHFIRSEVDRVWPPARALAPRSLTHEQQALLITELSELSPEVHSSQVSFTPSGSESHGYWEGFFDVFTRAGLTPHIGTDLPRSPDEVGVMVVLDTGAPGNLSEKLRAALLNVGIDAHVIERDNPSGFDLRLYIGPQPL